MTQKEQPPPELLADSKASLTWVLKLSEAYAEMVYPFSRCGRGKRARGMAGVFAFFGLMAIVGQTQSPTMLLYFYLWLLMTFWTWATADRNQDYDYVGWPWIAHRVCLGLVRNEFLLRRIEAILCGVFGYILSPYSPVLGRFLVAGFFILNFKCGMEKLYRERARDVYLKAMNQMRQQAEWMK